MKLDENPAGIRGGVVDANRNARVAFAHRRRVETTNATANRVAFVTNAVQKTFA